MEASITLNDAIEHLKNKVRDTHNEQDKRMLQWLLELRTLRAQVRALQGEIDWLKEDYERLVLQTDRKK